MFGEVRRGGTQNGRGVWSGKFADRRMMVIAPDDDSGTVVAVILTDKECKQGSLVRLARTFWPLVE